MESLLRARPRLATALDLVDGHCVIVDGLLLEGRPVDALLDVPSLGLGLSHVQVIVLLLHCVRQRGRCGICQFPDCLGCLSEPFAEVIIVDGIFNGALDLTALL